MLRNYYKYLPWLILAAFVSYGGATHYAQTTFDLFYLTAIFMIVYVALLYLHEHYLKYKYKDLTEGERRTIVYEGTHTQIKNVLISDYPNVKVEEE